jgi:uncharacterized protein with gpF-like domain
VRPDAAARAILGAVDRHADQLARQLASVLGRTADAAVRIAKDGGDASVATFGLADRLAGVLAPKLVALHEIGADQVRLAVDALEEKGADRFQTVREAWARNHAAAKVRGIAETTRKLIRRRVERAVRDQTPPTDLARDLRKLLGGRAARARAARIARTELHQAANIGQMDEAARQAQMHGRRFVKVWRATGDSRTRASHKLANGQAKPIGEPFIVGGAALMHPGDPAGPPRETVNCRCTMTLVPEKAAAGQGLAVVRRTSTAVVARLGTAEARAEAQGRLLAVQRGGELNERAAPKVYEALAREAVQTRRALAAPRTMTATERAAFEALGKRRGLRLAVDPDLPAGAIAAYPRPPMLIQLASEVDDQILFRDLIALLMENADAPV